MNKLVFSLCSLYSIDFIIESNNKLKFKNCCITYSYKNSNGLYIYYLQYDPSKIFTIISKKPTFIKFVGNTVRNGRITIIQDNINVINDDAFDNFKSIM